MVSPELLCPRNSWDYDGVHANGFKPRRALTGAERVTEYRVLEGAREMCMLSPELLSTGRPLLTTALWNRSTATTGRQSHAEVSRSEMQNLY